MTAVFLLVLQGGVARAQTGSDAAIAQSLFDEGRKLMNEKKYTEACPRLERSYKLDAAAGTLLNLAVCHEAVGKTASALNEFRDSVAMARRENRRDRVAFAQKHIEALKGRICTLTVNQAGHESGLEWKIDGIKVGTESLGIALPIDRGSHTVEATAPGKIAWKTTIDFEKDGEAQTLEIPALAAAPPPKIEPAQQQQQPPPLVTAKPHGGVSPWIGVTIGIGVAGFGVMALGGIESLSYWSDRKSNCGLGGDPNACNQAGIDADKSARTWAIVADVGLGVGIAGTIASVVVAVVGRGKSKETRVSVSPFVSPNASGFAVGGVF